MNPAHFEAFSKAYAPAVLQATVELGPYLMGKTVEQYAQEAAMAMLDTVKSKGIEAIEHYILNTRGGAFRLTCAVLGIDNNIRAMRSYLDGG